MNHRGHSLMLGILSIGCLLAFSVHSAGQRKSDSALATRLLEEGNYYQSIDDTSDRAADRYRKIIRDFPNLKQAEPAQFYLGTYYHKKFYILKNRHGIEDWSSINEAEAALLKYVYKYGNGKYLADAYHALTIMSLRRGNRPRASELLGYMKNSAANDSSVNIYMVIWSRDRDDVVKKECGSKYLAEKTREFFWKTENFESAVRSLRDWCNYFCRPE